MTDSTPPKPPMAPPQVDPAPEPAPAPARPRTWPRLSDVFSYKRTVDGILLKIPGNMTWEEQLRLGVRPRDLGLMLVDDRPGRTSGATPVPPQRKRGRKPDPGRWRTRAACFAELRSLFALLKQEGESSTQDNVGLRLLGTDTRGDPGIRVRRWLKKAGVTWEEVLRECRK